MFLRGVGLEGQGSIPQLLFMAYQGTFAIITAALISGAVVERMRFGPYLIFLTLWSLVVYAPVAHWVWGGGCLARLGALDFAGGTVVHVNAGSAALVAAFVLGPRKDYGRLAFLPHNVPFTLLGAGLLWFGWFGFNAGSALAANASAALAFVNTMLAPAAALVAWTLLDLRRTGKATAVGAATAIVVGLVAVTPAAGYVSPAGRDGARRSSPRSRATSRSNGGRGRGSTTRWTWWPPTGSAGTVGALLTGVLAQKAWNSGAGDGLLFGNPRQLAVQALAVAAAMAFSAAGTFALLKLIGAFTPLRAASRSEGLGLDVSEHGEEAYTHGEGAILVLPREKEPSAPPIPVPSSSPREAAHEARGRDRPPRPAARRAGGPLPGRGHAASPSAGCRATAARPSRSRTTAGRR